MRWSTPSITFSSIPHLIKMLCVTYIVKLFNKHFSWQGLARCNWSQAIDFDWVRTNAKQWRKRGHRINYEISWLGTLPRDWWRVRYSFDPQFYYFCCNFMFCNQRNFGCWLLSHGIVTHLWEQNINVNFEKVVKSSV